MPLAVSRLSTNNATNLTTLLAEAVQLRNVKQPIASLSFRFSSTQSVGCPALARHIVKDLVNLRLGSGVSVPTIVSVGLCNTSAKTFKPWSSLWTIL